MDRRTWRATIQKFAKSDTTERLGVCAGYVKLMLKNKILTYKKQLHTKVLILLTKKLHSDSLFMWP